MVSTQLYRNPKIDCDTIEWLPGNQCKQLIIKGRNRETLIDVTGDVEQAVAVVERLRTDKQYLFSSLAGQESPDVVELARGLDQVGWICESDLSGQDVYDRTLLQLQSIVDDAENYLSSIKAFCARSREGDQRFDDVVATVQRWSEKAQPLIHWPNAHCSAWTGELGIPQLGRASAILKLLLHNWRITSPVARSIFLHALAGLSDGRGAQHSRLDFGSASIATIDPMRIRSEVWSACLFLLEALQGGAAFSAVSYKGSALQSTSGLNAMIAAEDCAEQFLAKKRNAVDVFDAIAHPQSGMSAAAGVYLHQYFVTQRYVDCVGNFLRSPLRPGLKAEGTRYLLEEVGHDEHEKEACLSLGLSEAEIMSFAPLPYFHAYVEILDYVATADPLAFCMSVAVAEGMPGQRKRLADAITAAGYGDEALQVHTDLDMALEHSRFPRLLISQVPWTGERELLDALRIFLVVLEVSQLAWVELANFASDVRELLTPKAFMFPPERMVRITPGSFI